MRELVVAGVEVGRGAALEPVQRAFARQPRAVVPLRLQPIGQQSQHRIEAQRVVVVHILVAQGDGDDPLTHQRRSLVDHQVLSASVTETPGHPPHQVNGPIRMAQQKRPRVGRDRAPVKPRYYTAARKAFKFELC